MMPDPDDARREGLGFLLPISSVFGWCIQPGGFPSCAAGPAPPSASPCRTESTIRCYKEDNMLKAQTLNIFERNEQIFQFNSHRHTDEWIVLSLFHTQYLFFSVFFKAIVCCEESLKRSTRHYLMVRGVQSTSLIMLITKGKQMASPWWGQPTLCRIQLQSQSPIQTHLRYLTAMHFPF